MDTRFKSKDYSGMNINGVVLLEKTDKKVEVLICGNVNANVIVETYNKNLKFMTIKK